LEDEKRISDRLDLKLQLLPKLPARSLKRTFAVQQLPTWELPQAAVTLVEWPLADQVGPSSLDDGRDDRNV